MRAAKAIAVRWVLLMACATLAGGCAAVVVGGVAAGAIAADDRRGIGHQIDDQRIENTARRLFDREAALEGARIKAIAHNGVLLLAGEVHSDAQRDHAGQLAGRIEGARRIVNELAVVDRAGPFRRTRDGLLTARAKTALLDLGLPGFDATKVNVTAVRGEVYVMGLATRREADVVVETIRDLRGVRRVVKVFEYLD